MKKVFCLTFVLLSAIGIFAQERVLEQAEFDAVMKKRFAKFYGQPHRQTTSFADVSKDSKRAISWKTVRETGAARRLRTLYEFDSPTIRTRQETIIVDGKIYTRKDGGEWTEKSLASEFGNRTVRDSKLKTVEEKTEYKSLGTQVVFDLTASVYEKIERKKLVNEENQTEMFSTTTTKYWLDQDGGIIKEESLTENIHKSERNPSGSATRGLRTSVWEFDPNIKIDAPTAGK